MYCDLYWFRNETAGDCFGELVVNTNNEFCLPWIEAQHEKGMEGNNGFF